MDVQTIQTFLSTTATELAMKILAAIAFWVVGRWLIGWVIGMMQTAMGRNHVDPTLTKYLGSIIAIALNIGNAGNLQRLLNWAVAAHSAAG